MTRFRHSIQNPALRGFAASLGSALMFAPSPLLPVLAHNSVLAHNVEVSGQVAVMFHIEPNHNPRAGQPSKTWFTLTRKGGSLIPLQRCNCRLRVFQGSRTTGQPMLQPVLRAIDVERYRGIPGTTLTFPKAGLYTLQLTGDSKNKGDFPAFSVSYPVTVGS
jgi:hypothetical protein